MSEISEWLKIRDDLDYDVNCAIERVETITHLLEVAFTNIHGLNARLKVLKSEITRRINNLDKEHPDE